MISHFFNPNTMVKPFSDTTFDMTAISPHFDDVEKLWEEVKSKRVEKTDIAKMALLIIDNFVQLNLNPRLGYYPSIFINEAGIHAGIFLDLDMEHIRKTDDSVHFFAPHHILSIIEQ